MANELRKYGNWIGGLVEDNPLAAAATILTSAGLASMPAVGSTEHMLIIFNPDGLVLPGGSAPFAKRVTAHTASASTATIEAAAVIGTAYEIPRDIPWVHGPVAEDLNHMAFAKVGRSAVQSLADATWVPVQWNAEIIDPLGWHDDVTQNTRITPTLPGYYDAIMIGAWAGNATGERYLAAAKNGTRIRHLPTNGQSAGILVWEITERYIYMNGTTDYLEMHTHQTSGGALDFRTEGTFTVKKVTG